MRLSQQNRTISADDIQRKMDEDLGKVIGEQLAMPRIFGKDEGIILPDDSGDESAGNEYVVKKGGAGSGNFGHSGRAGEVGGSGAGGSVHEGAISAILSSKGGFTVNVVSGEVPKDGWAFAETKGTEDVAPATMDEAELTARLEKFIEKNAEALNEKDKFLGGWESEGKLYLDVSTVIPADKKDEAMKRANDAKQIAIFNLKTFEEVKTDYGNSGQKREADSTLGTGKTEDDEGRNKSLGSDDGEGDHRGQKSVNLNKALDGLKEIMKEKSIDDILENLQEVVKGGAGSGRRAGGGASQRHMAVARQLYNGASQRAHYASARGRGMTDTEARQHVRTVFKDAGDVVEKSEDVNDGNMEILKVDDSKRMVYGVFLWPNEADHDGDVISADDIEKVAHGFMKDYRAIDEMHGKDAISADIVESGIAWEDGLNYYGKTLKKGAWFGGVKVYDDGVWDKVKNGTYKGFSVRISGVRETIE